MSGIAASNSARRFRFSLRTLLLLIVLAAFSAWAARHYYDGRPMERQAFSAQLRDRYLGEGRIVVVSFFADWTFSCLINERVVFQDPDAWRAIRTHNVVPMAADWTNASAEIKHELAAIGVSSIPLIVIYSPTDAGNPIVLRDLVAVADFLAALEGAARQTSAIR